MAEETKETTTEDTEQTVVAEKEAETASAESETKGSEQEQEEQKEQAKEISQILKDAERDDEGNFIIKTEDGSAVFKGKTEEEVVRNMLKSVSDTNKYIRELKASTVKVPDTFKGLKEEKVVEAPVYEDILLETQSRLAKQHKVDPERVTWTDQKWIEYGDEQGWRDFQLSREIARVEAFKRQVAAEADKVHTHRNQAFVNDLILEDETESVRKVVATTRIDISSEKYEEILEAVHKDKSNFDANGLLRSGKVVNAVWEYIYSQKTNGTKSKLRTEVDKEIAEAQKAKDKIKTGVSSPAPYKPKPKSYGGDYDKAADDAKKEYRLAK